MITATLKTYRQSPRKVRLAANLIKGKPVERALVELKFLSKRAGTPLAKLLNSAVANAEHNFGARRNELMVQDIRVDKGIVFKRFMPRARGSASPIRKRTSNITITLTKLPTTDNKQPKKALKNRTKKL
jgi:large subunit ribosomal protein L22